MSRAIAVRTFVLGVLVGCSPSSVPRPAGALECPGAPPPVAPAADGTPLPAAVAQALAPYEDVLADAQRAGQLPAVEAAVCEARAVLGPWQGVAEAPASYVAAPIETPDPGQVLALVVEAMRTTLPGSEPWTVVAGSTDGVSQSAPLRGACDLVRWLLAASTVAGEPDAAALRESAHVGLEWLLQVQAPSGVFPFPDLFDDWERFRATCVAGGQSEAACLAAAPRAVQLAVGGRRAWEAMGMPPGVLVNGWFLESPGDPGGLQFDNGVCGTAMLAGYAAFDDARFLASARAAADWAATIAPVPNWNYNAFSVELMARLDGVDDSRDWRTLALDRVRLGVLPGLLPTGRFFDPHNARLVYHWILLRGVAALATRVDDPTLHAALALMHERATGEILERGAAGIDDGIEALLLCEQAGLASAGALARLVNAGIRNGKANSGGVSLYAADRLGR